MSFSGNCIEGFEYWLREVVLVTGWIGSQAVILQQLERPAAMRSEAVGQRCFRGNVERERQLSRKAVIRSCSW